MTGLLDDLGPEVGPRCLVTGASGYLGRRLTRALTELGCTVRAVDTAPPDPDLPEGAEALQADVRDAAAMREACADRDTVFHCAAVMSFVGLAPRAERERVFAVNVDGARNLIEGCRAEGVGRLVYTSSANVVIDRPIVEADERAPYASRFLDFYGESKALAEALVLGADEPTGLRTAALRPGGIWGDGDGGYMVRTFIEQLAAGRFVATIGSGEAVVDNTHVTSLVRAELLAARALAERPDEVGGRAFFITDDERINGVEWFRPIVEGLGLPFPTRRVPGRLMYLIAWLGELVHRWGGPVPTVSRSGVLKLTASSSFRVDAARRALGYEPLLGRDEGLARHLDDYRSLYETLRAGARV